MTPDGYILSSLELPLRQGGLNVAMSNLTVTLRNASGNNPSSTVLATFTNPDSPALSTTFQTLRFTLSRSVALDSNTQYFIHLSNNHSSDSLGMASTNSDNQDSGGLAGWGIDNNSRRVSGISWTNLSTSQAIQIRLDGYELPRSSNHALEYLNIDDVSLFRHSFSGVERYVGLSGILSITSTVTLRFKLDDPTATCEVKQSSLDLTNTDANLASATTVLASSSCSSSAENVLAVNLPVGFNDLAVLVTAQDGDIQKHGVALNRPSAPNAELLEGQATGWIIDFGSTVGSGGGDVHIRTWGDAMPGVDYELFRQTGTSPSPTYVKLDAPDYATPMPSDGRVTIILNAVDNPLEENTKHVQIALYPATSGIPEHPVEAAILDNDVAVTFGAATYTAAEGGTAVVTVNLSRDLGRDFEIPLTATGQNGATPADFEIPANVAITAGQTSATFTVTIVDDSIPESGESVELSFTGAPNNSVQIQAGGIATATVSIEGDSDTGVGVSLTELAIAEGGSGVYTVSLVSQPTGAVTVTVTGHSGTDLTVSPTELTFTGPSSQTVTVTANPDLVQTSYVATLMHMVAGADYGANVMAESVTVRVMNFTGGVAVSETGLEIAEGESEVYTVSLRSQPTGVVTVTVAGHSLTDLTVSPTALTFTGSSWGSQTITVTANPDLVQNDYVETLTHMVAGAGYGANNVMAESVTVTVMNFTGGVAVSLTELAVGEGESEVYTVSLESQPTGAVTVTVAGHSGTDLTVSPAELIFTGSSWGAQTVTVTANPDLVQNDYVETLTHMVAGANYGANNVMAEPVTVRVMNFTGGVAVSPTELAVGEGESEVYTVSLESQPTGAVTVTVAGHSGTDLTVSPTALIFTGSSWGSQTVTVTANPDLVQTDYVATLMHMVAGANYGANNAMAESVTVTVMDDQVVRLPIRPDGDGMVTVPPEGGMALARTQVILSDPVNYPNHWLAFKEVAKLGLTDFPPGFMPDEVGAVIVDIMLVRAGTMMEVPLQSPATVCLPTDRPGLRVYHYDAGEASPRWMVLPLPSGDSREGLACGVTESFAWFALGTPPSDAAEAWLARFGRTVAAHVVEAVSSRLATSTPQQEVTLGGVAPQSALLSGALQTLSDGTVPDARALLSGSSFVLPLSGTGKARWTAWGRGAYTEFDGQEDGTSLDGEVLTSTVGLDWARDRWLAGIAVSRSEGDGDIREEFSSEEIDVSLTGAHPYLRYETEQGISIWGLLGWGEGDLERKRDSGASEVDLEMRMGALGARGWIGSYKGFDLSLKSDALAVRLETDAEEDAPEMNADASRVRVLLEGAGHYPLKSGGSVAPILEAGLRWDEGDAETGLGMELGARMRYSGVGSRLTAELMARALVVHEESAYDEWGVGGSVRLHADELGRGPSLKLESGYGAAESTTGQLWSESGLESFAGQDTSSPSQRFEMELGYGLNTAGGLGVWTPYVGLERLRMESVWRLGGRLELGETLSLQLQGLLRSPAQAVSEHELSVHVSGRW